MSEEVTWLERANSRVITNTITKLRIMRKQQSEDCLVEAYRRIETDYAPEEVDAAANPFDLLTEQDRDELCSRYPLSSLSEAAETFEADLEVKWRSTLRLMETARPSAAATRSTGGCSAYYRPQWAFQQAAAVRSDQSQKRLRETDDDDSGTTNETYGASQWLRDLSNVGAVNFAKSCVLQSATLERNRREETADSPEFVVPESTKKLLGHLSFAEERCIMRQQKRCDEAQHSHTPAVGSALAPTSSSIQQSNIDIPSSSDFIWKEVPLKTSVSSTDDDDLIQFLWPSEQTINSFSCGAVMYASFDMSTVRPKKHHWQGVMSSNNISIRLPRDLVAGTVIIPGRGELAVSKVRWS
ncbi:Hypothetical protein, putative [Bodo saltans]|uniref:Uncharacterized protein n=1 Tax=Bodo saltans TaxID=75058 RepID=A0A0S4JGU3_BODSA|nr:Hypothetical protein, putative [Bodo saltans]|eukprot:CUG90712.1 Hypothetical protein, putative [Bodo saltans]